MKNKIMKLILSAVLSMTFMMGFTHNVNALKMYQITYSPGLIGSFSEELLKEYQKEYGKEKVALSKATGNITIQVAATKTMPNAPTAKDIQYKEQTNSNKYFVLTSGWQPAATTVTENETYVVQYGVLNQGVEYSIRYVDQTTLQDVASPVIGKANANEVISAYAKNVNNYIFNTQSKSIELTEDPLKNIITFYYTATEQEEVIDQIEENIITRDRVEVLPGNDQENNANTIIPDNQTPLGGETEQTPDTPTTDIEENETPLAKADDLTQNNEKLYYAMGGTLLAVLAVIIIVTAKKKKKA